MRAARILIFVLVGLGMVACASVPPNPLSADERSRMQVTRVAVDYRGKLEPEKVASMMSKLEAAMRATFLGRSSGMQPTDVALADGAHSVKLTAQISYYSPNNAFKTFMVGASDNMSGDLVVQDVETGTVLARYRKIMVTRQGAGGLVGLVAEGIRDQDDEGFLAAGFTQEALNRYQSESELSGVRSVEEMAAANAELEKKE